MVPGNLWGFFGVARKHPWRILHYQRGDIDWLLDVWRAEVVVSSGPIHPSFRETKGPALISVNNDGDDGRRVASVSLDEEAIGTLATEHLLERGLTQLTTFRFNDARFAMARERAFKKTGRASHARFVPGWWHDRVSPPRSSEGAAVDDEIVARALAWIAKNASRKVSLNAVARASGCSRQWLEVRFRAAIGRTVMQEVRRTRIEMAKSLLTSSTATLAEIAERSGFADAASLSVSFRRKKGLPPGAYRRRVSGVDVEE